MLSGYILRDPKNDTIMSLKNVKFIFLSTYKHLLNVVKIARTNDKNL